MRPETICGDLLDTNMALLHHAWLLPERHAPVLVAHELRAEDRPRRLIGHAQPRKPTPVFAASVAPDSSVAGGVPVSCWLVASFVFWPSPAPSSERLATPLGVEVAVGR